MNIVDDLNILVLGGNGCWAKGDTLEEAFKLACRPKQYIAYIVHRNTSVDGMGALIYPRDAKPKEIIRKGFAKKKKETKA